MELNDIQLQTLIEAGLSDSEIMHFVHENTGPADLYGKVAEAVTAFLTHDALILEQIRGSKNPGAVIACKMMDKLDEDELFTEVAKWWVDLGVSRKDTKKIVMTYLYGSKEYGNRDSIQERIDERAEEILDKGIDPYFDRSGADEWKEHRSKAITLMVRLTRCGIAMRCPSTVQTMDTLSGWAESLGARDIPLKWRSPLGALVYQSNPNFTMREVDIYEDGRKVAKVVYREEAGDDAKQLNGRKMGAGTPPNFVHTHDACHMQMVVNATDSEDFHLIHDEFGTQIADSPKLAKAIRQCAINMYGGEADVLMDMWLLNGGDESYLSEPEPMGELKVESVMDSLYFFS